MAISDKVIIYNSIGNPFPSYSEGIANDYIYGNNFHKLGIIGDKSQFTFLNSNEMTYNGFQYRSVSSGLNEYNFTTPSINDRWIGLYFNGYNNSWAIGQLKLIFSTGEKLSILDAIAQNYIYPSVAMSSWTHYDYYQNGWVDEWNNIVNISDGTTITNVGIHNGQCREALVMFKMKSSVANLTGIEFYSNNSFSPYYDSYTGGTSGLCMFMEPLGYNITFVPINAGVQLSKMLKIKKTTLSTYPLEVTFKPVQLRKAIYTEPELDTRKPGYPYRISYFVDENLNEYLIEHDSSSTPFSEDVALIYTKTNKLKYVGTTNPSVITYKYFFNGTYVITDSTSAINFDPDTFSANFDIYDVNGNLWYDATTTQFKPIRLRKAII